MCREYTSLVKCISLVPYHGRSDTLIYIFLCFLQFGYVARRIGETKTAVSWADEYKLLPQTRREGGTLFVMGPVVNYGQLMRSSAVFALCHTRQYFHCGSGKGRQRHDVLETNKKVLGVNFIL